MSNCLVTRLKATVNNAELPILETMQQFTLDAIAKGGGMVLSDNQKWGLNHFFYQIGAISNRGLWPKIRSIYIPLIGVGRTGVSKDYKDDSTLSSSSIVDKNGSLKVSATTSITVQNKIFDETVNIFNSSVFAASIPNYHIASENSICAFGVNSIRRSIGSNNRIESIITEGSLSFSVRAATEDTYYSVVANFNNVRNSVFAYSEDNQVIRNQSTVYGSPEGITASVAGNDVSSYTLRIDNNTEYGIIIDFKSELTESECMTVLNAVRTLWGSWI